MAKPTTLLVDGDQYLFKACAALEKEVQWDAQNHVLSCNAEEAWAVFTGSLEKLKDTLEGSRMFLAFSGQGNFRKALYEPYKSQRKGRKPLCYGRLLERAFKAYKCHSVDGLEADDLMGVWQTSGKFGDTIIVSDDKDMKTIPGRLYRDWGKEEPTIGLVTEHVANYNWLFQTLIGDTSDGYPGCPGAGPVTAGNLLTEFLVEDGVFMLPEAWEAVVRTYDKKGLTAEDALTQARIARILRASDWDSEKKEVKLWAP